MSIVRYTHTHTHTHAKLLLCCYTYEHVMAYEWAAFRLPVSNGDYIIAAISAYTYI